MRAHGMRRTALVVLAGGFCLWLVAGFLATRRLLAAERPRSGAGPAPEEWGRIGSVEELVLRTSDGEELAGWFVQGADAAGTALPAEGASSGAAEDRLPAGRDPAAERELPSVVLLHGNGGTRRELAPLVTALVRRGVPCLALTLRGHGASSGEALDFGWSSRHDLEAAVAWLEDRRPGAPTVVYGVSLGAATAIYAAEGLGERVRGYVLESPYASLTKAARDRCRRELPAPLDLVAYAGLRLWAPLLLDARLAELCPADRVGHFPPDATVVFLASSGDERAPAADVLALSRSCSAHARFERFQSDEHARLARSHTGRVADIVLGVIQEVGSLASSDLPSPSPKALAPPAGR